MLQKAKELAVWIGIGLILGAILLSGVWLFDFISAIRRH
jgi:small basic protein